MGRHSAPDDGDSRLVEEAAADQAACADVTVDQAAVAPPPDADAGPASAQPPPRSSGTRADVRLLREHSVLRARCAAAVVVPFVIYAAALFAVGRADVFLLWMWIPTVTAGVLFGSFLDAAHRRAT